MKRREVLAGVGVAVTAFAGCPGDSGENTTNEPSPTATDTETPTPTDTATPTETATPEPSIDPAELDGYIRPDDDPDSIPDELVCEDDTFKRQEGWIESDALQWGNLSDGDGRVIFALRVDSLTVERGDVVTFTFTNVTGEEQTTGNIYKSNFEVYTEAGWQAPRGWKDGVPKPVTDDLWGYAPGESYEATFEMSERGVVKDAYSPHRDELITCPGLPAGRYRFATAAPEQGDVGVAFDLTE